MDLGRDEQRPMGQGCAETNAVSEHALRAEGTPRWMGVGRSGAACSVVLQGRQTECGGDGLHSRSPEGKRSAQASADRLPQGGNDESPRGARRYGGSMPCTTARPGCAGRRKDNSGKSLELPMRSIWHLSVDSLCQRWRIPTAIERSRSERRRRAPIRFVWAHGGLAWPTSAVLCAFGIEGALHPLADSAGQALSCFMPSASIHKARLILTFWSMP
jgi:hypothetical protein